MDGWSLRNYRRPFLAVDPIRKAGLDRLVVKRGATVLELETGGHFGEVTRFLNSLRSPAAAGWSSLRKGRSPFAGVVDTLDSYGLIEDAGDAHREIARRERAELAGLSRATARWLRRALEVAPGPSLRRRLVQLRDTAARLLARGAGALPPAPADRSSLAWEVLHHQLRSWAELSPPSLAAAYLALEQALADGARRRSVAQARELVALHGGGLYEVHDTRVHLNTLAQLAVLSAGPGRHRPAVAFAARPRSGLNMMVAAERITAQVLGQLGRSRYREALESGECAERLARGTFVHQYFVTNRYVEVIEPLMRRRLRAPLRRQIYRYYAEEVGHEQHELQACERLGIDAGDVTSAVPVAFFAAYPEVFAQVGEDEPLGFLLSIPVAEGLPGTTRQTLEAFRASGVIDAAEKTISKHARVDESLAHATLARRVMATLPFVHPAAQRRAIQGLALMLEVNFAAWNMLHRYYADPARPMCPTFLGVSPEDLFAWTAEE
jgi:heme oxygenase-like protein